MSLDIEEAATWDEERIRDEVILRLEPNWTFRFGSSEDQMSWEASILDPDEVEVWSGSRITAQLVLLDALGWVESRHHKIPEASPWVRRRGDLDPQRVHDIAYSKSLGPPDPPDLDPNEIESVVRSMKKQ
jgi:hypothetical protein